MTQPPLPAGAGSPVRGRPWAAATAALLLVALLGVWLVSGLRGARARAQLIREAPAERAHAAASRLATGLGGELQRIAAAENQRPYYHYQNLYHDPVGASRGPAVVRSPLADRTGDPMIAAHFSIDGAGDVSLPALNPELPELSNGFLLDGARGELAAIRRAAPQLWARRSGDERSGDRSDRGDARAQLLAPGAYAQNSAANAIYRDVTGWQPPTRATGGAVTVVVDALAWNATTVQGEPRLVATRRVTTPDGTRVQGFVVDGERIAAWLGDRADPQMPARLSNGGDPAPASAPVPGADGWRVDVDASAAIASAAAEAQQITADFWWTFTPAAVLVASCCGLLLWLVARAEKLARQRSQFAASAAHELRTPLAGLQLYGDMLAGGLGDPNAAGAYARRIADEAARLGRVVSNVLGMSQLERGVLTVNATDGDVADAVRRALDRARHSLDEAELRLTAVLPDRAPGRFDDDAVARIVQNLLDNAEKYTRGSPERAIRVEVVPGRERVVVRVDDTGPGISAAVRPHLFEPFRRTTDPDHPAGLGLGLALARALARAQGGDVRCVPRARGARFELELPGISPVA